MRMVNIGLVVFCLLLLPQSHASIGDRSPVFENCVSVCYRKQCSTDLAHTKFTDQQALIWRWTGWSCNDECRYDCMWPAVEQFRKSRKSVPQFGGKWPFVRWMGLQEPASAVFSAMNLASFVLAARKMINYRAPPRLKLLRSLWIMYFWVGVVAWLCSTIFHSRDTPLTEKLDYFCAFAVVLFGLYASLIRIFGPEKKMLYPLIGVPIVAYFCSHINHLCWNRFDYGYHVRTAATIGLMNSVTWLVWCSWMRIKYGVTYVKTCAFVILTACSFMLLELFDFPPILWTFDAHALWHLGTSPLPFYWIQFILNDCHFLELLSHEKTV